MITPCWGIISRTSVQDSATGNISLIDLIDEFIFEDAPEMGVQSEIKFIPLQFCMNMCWEFEQNFDLADSPSRAIVVFLSPDGRELKKETPSFMRMQVSPDNIKAVIQVGRFPFVGWGDYSIEVTPQGYEDQEASTIQRLNLKLVRAESYNTS